MALLSRSFVVISLAAAMSVSAPAFAFAQESPSSHPVDVAASDAKEQLLMFDSDLVPGIRN